MLKNLFKIKIPIVVKNKSTCSCRLGKSLIFGKYLLLTNTLTSGFLMMLGDLCEQEFEYEKKILSKRYDYGRLTRMFVIGIAIGPINHHFYIWLDKIMPDRNFKTIRRKIMMDQFTMSPLCIALLFYGVGIMESKPISQCTEEFKSKFADTYMMDWFLCVPAQIVNFYYVPVKYQVLYVNCVALVYNIFLSYFKHN